MSFCSLAHLAQAVGQSERFVAKDIKRMIGLGFFPQAHLDAQETCLILDHETYARYLEAEESRKRRRRRKSAAVSASKMTPRPRSWKLC